MRLIDADELVWLNIPYGCDVNIAVVLKRDIDSAPTVDAVPVVRCINCQHCDNDVIVQKLKNGTERRINICLKHQSTVADDYFCADGKERDKSEQN